MESTYLTYEVLAYFLFVFCISFMVLAIIVEIHTLISNIRKEKKEKLDAKYYLEYLKKDNK